MKIYYTSILFFIATLHCSAQLRSTFGYGYTDKLSYRADGSASVTFYSDHSSITQTSFDLKDFSSNTFATIDNFNPTSQATPSSSAYRDGYNWTPTKTWIIPNLTNVSSGYYMLDGKIPIIIKGDNTIADIVIVCPTNTINAYTTSGGSSLYVSGTELVSFLRPQHIAQAYCSDFIKWIMQWIASSTTNPNGYTVNFISDTDMDDYTEIENAKLLIVPGHSEYWTRQARLNFDRFVDEGVNEVGHDRHALILSGNTMWWQVRYQYDPNNAANPQLVCHRGSNWGAVGQTPVSHDDPIQSTNPLLATYHWNEPSLKYSILSSIGSDWLRGGVTGMTYSGFNMLMEDPQSTTSYPKSPLLNGTNLLFHQLINIAASPVEYDGTLMKSDENGNATLDANGDPELDLSALGFYRAEMIGYDKLDQSYPDEQPGNLQEAFCPFMVFQKTSTSGTIINTNINRWCSHTDGWTGTNPQLKVITENMINLMIDDIANNQHGNNLFSNPTPPTSITVSPAYTNVSYSACDGGSINFTPNGIYLDQAYKIDNGYTFNYNPFTGTTLAFSDIYQERDNNTTQAEFDATCGSYQAFKIGSASNEKNTANEQTDELIFSLYPNPTMSTFMLQIQTKSASVKDVSVYNAIGTEIFHLEKLSASGTVIDLANNPKGIYFVKLIQEGKETVKKIIYM